MLVQELREKRRPYLLLAFDKYGYPQTVIGSQHIIKCSDRCMVNQYACSLVTRSSTIESAINFGGDPRIRFPHSLIPHGLSIVVGIQLRCRFVADCRFSTNDRGSRGLALLIGFCENLDIIHPSTGKEF